MCRPSTGVRGLCLGDGCTVSASQISSFTAFTKISTMITRAIDFLLKHLAIFAIRLYQLFGRRFVRRTCLFQPSCSRRAVTYFTRYGFRKGLKLTREQLSECRANYSLRLNQEGEVEMVTLSGNVISETEINPRIASRMRMFWGTLPSTYEGAD